MGIKKKKNVIILTTCMITCFILYQLYFFLTITSEATVGMKVIQVVDHDSFELIHVKSEQDKYINENGMIKGVYFTNIKKYRPNSKQEFKCITSEQRILFDQVNDDYCDCEDGTDEPSTSACPTGLFYCDTQYQKKNVIKAIPSSKVNDGICDCCDGSDEWVHKDQQKLLSQSTDQHYRFYVTKCPNNCI